MPARLSLSGVPRGFLGVSAAQGSIQSIVSLAAFGAFIGAPQIDQPSGGYFETASERAAWRRRHRKLEKETQALPESVDREIAMLERELEAEDQRIADLERLRSIVADENIAQAARDYGERVARSLERAIEKGTYSALEALDREIERALEEEESVALAITMILDEY